jgi:hypothetical protein
MFSKSDMQEQLKLFIARYASSVDRMLGTDLAEQMENVACVEATTLWWVSNQLYDYGVLGVPLEGFGTGNMVDSVYADVELFLSCIEQMDNYLAEDSVVMPHRAMKVVTAAIARHVLDGGDRYLLDAARDDGYLSLSEIAVLADMDERSVRNAASSKNPDALNTVTINKRTMISVAEARRWLAGRKGFVPTQNGVTEESSLETKVTVPRDIAKELESRASAAGISIAQFIENLMTGKN